MVTEKITIVVGFDQKEAVAYHAFCQSVMEKASVPLQIMPLAEKSLNVHFPTQSDGSNKFIYSRFLTPYLNSYQGWAIFADGDMICQQDIKELWDLRDDSKAVMVVKHDYKTKAAVKYLHNKNEDYPRKNWSSLILWNCGHPANKLLTPEFIREQTGAFLHRFTWLEEEEIGELNSEWNWLAIEYPENYQAKLIHYTLGTPCFKDYAETSMADLWKAAYQRLQEGTEK